MSTPPVASRAPRGVSDFVVDRLREPWSLGGLASTLGLSSRTLNRLTRREAGVPPMVLLRRVRLEQARSELEAPTPRTSVTNVALDCGFNHLGRFSVDYARRYGEPPSETLRRARRRVAAGARRPSAAVDLAEIG
jgi:transcriptional regulator GlxA family with amidase domain